ncbi:MAG: hypothetical protein AVDCRST_MAG68-801 [uncultured Gemmatimonadetes bacterium]|uniref:DUF2207 domain-containing protein n=1 Tax=uncultured Gemmatimonadota bacterium TaxID=203437 RepID=A0A6J4KI76_9BACT|nr:MAG: hypothetical protein AVDCRST_MAG68-801 [uncultured Gemmatimonadota bacterium]
MRLILLLLLALAAPAAGQEPSIRVRDFDALLVVTQDGTLDVTERLTLGFTGQWNGVNRDLSLRHKTAEGRTAALDVEIGSVTDGDGKPLRVEEERIDDGWGRRLKIWVPGARDAERRVVIRYRVANAIRFFYEGSEPGPMDELYWNVTGNAWDMPVDRARGRVVLPRGARPRQHAVYTGAAGTTLAASNAESRVTERGLEFAVTRPLESYEGVTVAAGWAPGFVASRPSERERGVREMVRLWPLALPLLAFGLSFRAWRRRGRDPEEESIVVRYEPPLGMSPTELGTLIDHEAQMRDITATLVDLAVRGYVGIEERTEEKLMGLLSSTEFTFHRRRPREDWGALAQHEQLYLQGLFQHATTAEASWDELRAVAHASGPAPEAARGGEQVALSALTDKFYTALPEIRDAVYESLVTRGFYLRRPDQVRTRWMFLAGALLVAGAAGAGWVEGLAWDGVSPVALAAGMIASAVIVFIFSRVMPARTPAGARAREAALGFREFLGRVESERYRRMVTSPEMFERYLPHAMAFGVEDRWAHAFEEIYREPPRWYSGSGQFRATDFSSRMSHMSSTAGSTMSSSPSSSGSGGGGSSGGGSGGGGGSGF